MIQFSSVTKQFLPDSYALKDVSFSINTGELVVFTGPSGSGKTTIMKLLTKEYTPTTGEILFNDTDISNLHNSQVHTLRRKIGVVFQDYKLIPELNIWENIALPLAIVGKSQEEIEERVTDLLSLVSLTERAFHFPKQLSGGEAQRISIARALSTGPSVIFADEPTGNLDKENSIQIAKLLAKINSLGTTVLFATHDHDLLDLFEDMRHIILKNGTVVSDTGVSESSETKKSEKPQKKSPQSKETQETKNTKPENKDIDTEKTQDSPEKQVEADVTESEQKSEKKAGFLSRLFSKSKKNKTKIQETVEELEETEDSQSKPEDESKTTQTKNEDQETNTEVKKEEQTDKEEKKPKKKTKKSSKKKKNKK